LGLSSREEKRHWLELEREKKIVLTIAEGKHPVEEERIGRKNSLMDIAHHKGVKRLKKEGEGSRGGQIQ